MVKSFIILALLGSLLLSSASHAEEVTDKEKTLKNKEESKMSDEKLSGKWDQLVGSLKEKWGKLTDQDLEKVKGKKDKLVGLIKEKYGDTKEEIEEAINKLLDKLK